MQRLPWCIVFLLCLSPTLAALSVEDDPIRGDLPPRSDLPAALAQSPRPDPALALRFKGNAEHRLADAFSAFPTDDDSALIRLRILWMEGEGRIALPDPGRLAERLVALSDRRVRRLVEALRERGPDGYVRTGPSSSWSGARWLHPGQSLLMAEFAAAAAQDARWQAMDGDLVRWCAMPWAVDRPTEGPKPGTRNLLLPPATWPVAMCDGPAADVARLRLTIGLACAERVLRDPDRIPDQRRVESVRCAQALRWLASQDQPSAQIDPPADWPVLLGTPDALTGLALRDQVQLARLDAVRWPELTFDRNQPSVRCFDPATWPAMEAADDWTPAGWTHLVERVGAAMKRDLAAGSTALASRFGLASSAPPAADLQPLVGDRRRSLLGEVMAGLQGHLYRSGPAMLRAASGERPERVRAGELLDAADATWGSPAALADDQRVRVGRMLAAATGPVVMLSIGSASSWLQVAREQAVSAAGDRSALALAAGWVAFDRPTAVVPATGVPRSPEPCDVWWQAQALPGIDADLRFRIAACSLDGGYKRVSGAKMRALWQGVLVDESPPKAVAALVMAATNDLSQAIDRDQPWPISSADDVRQQAWAVASAAGWLRWAAGQPAKRRPPAQIDAAFDLLDRWLAGRPADDPWLLDLLAWRQSIAAPHGRAAPQPALIAWALDRLASEPVAARVDLLRLLSMVGTAEQAATVVAPHWQRLRAIGPLPVTAHVADATMLIHLRAQLVRMAYLVQPADACTIIDAAPDWATDWLPPTAAADVGILATIAANDPALASRLLATHLPTMAKLRQQGPGRSMAGVPTAVSLETWIASTEPSLRPAAALVAAIVEAEPPTWRFDGYGSWGGRSQPSDRNVRRRVIQWWKANAGAEGPAYRQTSLIAGQCIGREEALATPEPKPPAAKPAPAPPVRDPPSAPDNGADRF